MTLEAAPDDADTAVIVAGGMSCPLCASSAEKQLERLPGFRAVAIDLGTGELIVSVDPENQPTPRALAEAVRDGGFTPTSVTWRKGG
ncbi:MAG: heavy metal-associated domain-containing protein [Planctomycetota bacterium]